MPCEHVRTKLTAYLDGELDGDRGTVVRGHLRTCDACRRVAADEAALRDGLRALPAVDPPPSMWAGVQARLAAAEVAESERPPWRRVVARWLSHAPSWRTAVAGACIAGATITIVYWRMQRDPGQRESPPLVRNETRDSPSPTIAPSRLEHLPLPIAPSADDVTADLAVEPARITASYKEAIDELTAAAADVRPSWSDDRRVAFDAKVKTLRAAIVAADEGKPRQRACRTLIRYLEGAAIRDDVALAGGMP
jgi:hypothetical protein